MTTITQPIHSPILSKLNNNSDLIPTSTVKGNANTSSLEPINNLVLPGLNVDSGGLNIEKPKLTESNTDLGIEQLTHLLGPLSSIENIELLGDIRSFLSLTPEKIQTVFTKVLTEEQSNIAQVVKNAQLPDEVEMKQIAQAFQVVLASSFFREVLNNQSVIDIGKNEVKSVGDARKSEFIGIMSSDILVELVKIIRKVMAEINISDRRISANFLMLNAKMVEAAAESTIKEGKEMFSGAMMGFFTSLAISSASAAFQAKSLRTQNQSIKNNLASANQNTSAADRLGELNVNTVSSPMTSKANSLLLKGKDGTSMSLTDQPTVSQQALSNQRGAEAAQRTNKLGLAESQEHERIMNKTRVKMGVAEQGGRLSDNAGQMATAANQVNVKAEEANKMTQQSVADVARSVSADKDKQVDKGLDTVKQMLEQLREIRESQLRTFQSVTRG